MKTKKITKILTMGLVACSLLAATSTSVLAAPTVEVPNLINYGIAPDDATSENSKKDYAFLETCNKVELGGEELYEKNGKYYKMSGYDVLVRNRTIAGGYFGLADQSLARNQWVHFTYFKDGATTTTYRYYGNDCKAVKGLQVIDGKKYLFYGEGNLLIGWKGLGKKSSPDGDNGWFYSYPDGSIKEGWLQYKGDWYYILENGRMARDTTIDGYKLNHKGIWVK